MFTGIIENTGIVKRIESDQNNKHFWLKCDFTNELKIDQSLAHNGVCLTVVEISGNKYKVTAIDETLNKTSLNDLKIGDLVNLERCMKLNDRLDGHIVQGHVDQTGVLKSIEDFDGSYLLTINYDENNSGNVTVPKGSICMNGISLTVVDSSVGEFSVAIIPYTWEHTNLKNLKSGNIVNLEFDILGKYIKRLMNK
ncbi:riboflavin synthase [Moheibacter sediminis]|uniref:Riboflavin synthase n=1 Tax=Moheibacter sediminis TaxID=1434700 RepID=A0A1W1Y7M3_9FLAO|nr:riboflavin synthase [Moheibacter sediminis]SMC32146.1 riboflavin synthase alpha chain [Moheibacter sediminis]